MTIQTNNKIIPIFFAVDDGYAPFLGVALTSMIKHASKEYNYHIYVLDGGVSDINKERIQSICKDNLSVQFVDMKQRIKESGLVLHTRDYYSEAIYYRLFIADLFPELDKALYLDADIVIVDDISKLYNHELGDNYLGVIAEDVMPSCQEFIDYAEKVIGIPVETYFNSGVLVMNLKKMRDEDLYGQFTKKMSQVTYIVAPDQDYLNSIAHGKVLYIDKYWNRAPIVAFEHERDLIKLFHFKLTGKPWNYSDVLFSDIFWKYAKMTEYYDYIHSILENYSEEDIKRDRECEVNLKKKAGTQAANPESVKVK